jgi:choline kinase
MTVKTLKAILLVAGEGTRLRPYTLDRPKCLVEVDGVSLLDRQLAVLRCDARVTRMVMIGGYKAEMLARPGIAVKLNPRYFETNMVWTLFSAEEELEGDILICYGDIVYGANILSALLDCDADIAITVDKDWESYWRARNEDPLADAETLKLHPDGRVYELGQKPRSLSEIEGQYMGLIKLSAKGVSVIKEVFNQARAAGALRGKPVEKAYMTDLLQAVIDAGYSLQSVPVHGGWIEVDTVDDLVSATTRARLKQIGIRHS